MLTGSHFAVQVWGAGLERISCVWRTRAKVKEKAYKTYLKEVHITSSPGVTYNPHRLLGSLALRHQSAKIPWILHSLLFSPVNHVSSVLFFVLAGVKKSLKIKAMFLQKTYDCSSVYLTFLVVKWCDTGECIRKPSPSPNQLAGKLETQIFPSRTWPKSSPSLKHKLPKVTFAYCSFRGPDKRRMEQKSLPSLKQNIWNNSLVTKAIQDVPRGGYFWGWSMRERGWPIFRTIFEGDVNPALGHKHNFF